MSDIKTPTRYSGIDRRAVRVDPGLAKSGTLGARDVYKPGGRHAAITNTLYNWHSYKNWADKARGNFDEKK